MTDPTGGVTITLKDIYDLVNQVRNDMIKTATHVETITVRNVNADALHMDHESRIRALEKWRYALPTSLGLAFASVAADIFVLVSKR